MKKYSIIRLLLSIALSVLMLIVVFSKTGYPNLLPIALLLIGSILFTLNRKWADYISFSIFIFGFFASITYKIDYCLKNEPCWDSVYYNLVTNEIESFYTFLSGLILLFLIFNFLRNKNTE